MTHKRKLLLSLAAAAAFIFFGSASAINLVATERAIEGQWFDLQRAIQGTDTSRGWNIDMVKIGPELYQAIILGFVYDNDGNPTWLVAIDPEVRPGDFILSGELSDRTGGSIGPEPGSPMPSTVGTFEMNFATCDKADFSWTTSTEKFGSGSLELGRLDAIGSESSELVGAPSQCPVTREFTECPDFSVSGFEDRTCIISGTYTEDITLTNEITWLISGGVFIGNKDIEQNTNKITIEPGTLIRGVEGIPVLTIARGAQIIAEGTKNAPIVMTGPNNADEGASSGDWGGLVINGRAPLNTCDVGVCTAVGEGDTGTYGGSDPNDSSGILKYVRVQFAGIKFTDEDELNGIALQGVGDGTVIDHIQVHRNADDGIEFFGGTVNAKHVILSDIEDDSLDWTQGWLGRVQYILIRQIQNPDVDTDRGIEADNLEQDNDATPRAQPKIANMTMVGKSGETGMTLRRGTGFNITNSIVTGFGRCIDIDSAATFAAIGTPAAPTGTGTMENSIVNCDTNFSDNDDDNDDNVSDDPYLVSDFFLGQPGFQVLDPMLNGFLPPVDASYLSGQTIDSAKFDAFFDKVQYSGAFGSKDNDWTAGWSEFLD